MKALTAYISQKNAWNAIFGGYQYEINTAQGRQKIAQSLECDLSPENLTCDGSDQTASTQAGSSRIEKTRP